MAAVVASRVPYREPVPAPGRSEQMRRLGSDVSSLESLTSGDQALQSTRVEHVRRPNRTPRTDAAITRRTAETRQGCGARRCPSAAGVSGGDPGGGARAVRHPPRRLQAGVSVSCEPLPTRLRCGLDAGLASRSLDYRRICSVRIPRKNSRMSATSRSGCSRAAKWPPRGISVQRTRLKRAATHSRGGILISFGKRA